MKKSFITVAVSIAVLGLTANVQAESMHMTSTPVSAISSENIKGTPNIEQMWKLLQQQQAEIQSLKQQLKQTSGRVEQAEVKVEATADAVERSRANSSSVSNWTDRTTIGGYGEMHYNNLDNQLNTPWASDDKAELDFHRFVIFMNYEFNDRTRFFSEVELEHSLSGDGEKGEVELEQAYIQYDIAGTQQVKIGSFLIPVGILNETHEPDTFYGVERNNVEKNIIPTTWWEGGVAFNGDIVDGLSYDFSVTNGLGLDASSGQYKIRDGRQEVSKADAQALAYTSRLKYTGVPGLELSVTAQYQEDLYQNNYQVMNNTQEVDAWLWEAHAVYENGPFALRALYAQWNIDDAIEVIKQGADRQRGFYVEPSFKVMDNVGVFTRYSQWDNQAGVHRIDSEYNQIDLGVNWWIAERVVIKFDLQDQETPRGEDEFDGFNLGVGFSY